MPSMPQLPRRRVTKSTPFSYTRLDYLGPLYVKTHPGTKKVWICLFTCMLTRAIHLELLQDMTAEEFLLGLRRFIARRGTPTEILSDNASQFKLSSVLMDRIWGEIIDGDNVTSYVANSGVKWNFIVEKAPWMGGTYERLVGLVKRCLRKAVGKVCLTNEQLLTYISEAEAVVNSRPIVYLGDDINSTITLTPAHFLTLNPKLGIPESDNIEDQDYDPCESSARTLLNTWKKGQRLLNVFWKIWKTDYLLSLRERFQNKLKAPRVLSCYTPSVGDIVLIHDNLPRGTWKMGKICELKPSYDEHIRSAKVLVSNCRIIGRPLNLLYPIECPNVTPMVNGSNGPDGVAEVYGSNGPDGGAEVYGSNGPDGGAEVYGSNGPDGGAEVYGSNGPDGGAEVYGSYGPDGGAEVYGSYGPDSGAEDDKTVQRPQRRTALESRANLRRLINSDSV